ncbi:MAG: glycosyltransferase family 2 protein [Candidatus Bathyarchaeia archaeon]
MVVDHYSTDRSVLIAKEYGAEIFYEDKGLGYARQVAIRASESPFILFVDSDIVFYDGEWFNKSINIFLNEPDVGAIGIDTPVKLPDWRMKYVNYWWSKAPWTRKAYFHNAYFLRREAINGIRMPDYLGAYEHIYIKRYIESRGWKIRVIWGNGIHYYDFPDYKGAWLGAGARVFGEVKVENLPQMLIRKVLAAPLKAIPPAIAYNDPTIVIQNTKYWFLFLKGWLKHDKYIVLKR